VCYGHDERKGVEVFCSFGDSFYRVNAGHSIFEYYDDMKKGFESQACADEEDDAMPLAVGYLAVGPWELGGEFKWPAGEFVQYPSTEPAVGTEEEAWNLKAPDVEELKTLGYMPRFMEFGKPDTATDYLFAPTALAVNNIISPKTFQEFVVPYFNGFYEEVDLEYAVEFYLMKS
jgi:hypothetical protein